MSFLHDKHKNHGWFAQHYRFDHASRMARMHDSVAQVTRASGQFAS